MVTDPTQVGDDTQEEPETMQVPKTEWDEQQTRLKGAEGYTRRKLEQLTTELQQKHEAEVANLKEELASQGDAGQQEVSKRILSQLDELTKKEKVFESEKVSVQQDKLAAFALNMATKHKLTDDETAKLAEGKTETEMENIALKMVIEKKPAPLGVPRGSGGATAGSSVSRTEIQKRLKNDPLSLSKEEREKYLKAFDEGRVTE